MIFVVCYNLKVKNICTYNVNQNQNFIKNTVHNFSLNQEKGHASRGSNNILTRLAPDEPPCYAVKLKYIIQKRGKYIQEGD